MGLRDLVLQQIVYVVGTVWVGTAAKLGQAQVAFWLAAMLLFYLPQAAVVIDLSRRMPLEGGPHQWARLGLNELMGFLVAWNLWVYAVVLIATIDLLVGTNLAYVAGPSGSWMASNKTFIMVLNAFLLVALMLLAALGLGVSKWLHNAGSIALMLSFAALIALPLVGLLRGTLPHYHPFALALPALTLFSLNVFGKIAMGALSGFEYVAVLAALAFGAAGIAGVGEQEAFQLLDNAAGIFYGLTYLVMFAIPLVGLRGVQPAPPAWLRAAAASGFAATALYVVLSIFPIIDVPSWQTFATKISTVVVALNLAGVALYATARRRRRSG